MCKLGCISEAGDTARAMSDLEKEEPYTRHHLCPPSVVLRHIRYFVQQIEFNLAIELVLHNIRPFVECRRYFFFFYVEMFYRFIRINFDVSLYIGQAQPSICWTGVLEVRFAKNKTKKNSIATLTARIEFDSFALSRAAFFSLLDHPKIIQ